MRILSFSAQSAVQITRFLGRKYGYLVLPTVLMPQKLTLFLCSSYKLFCPCYQIPGLYINWLSPSQLIKCNTMGAKKQEKKRLIRKRRERTNPHEIGSIFPVLKLVRDYLKQKGLWPDSESDEVNPV